MELKEMEIGKKVKFTDNPSCNCSICQSFKGKIVTIYNIYRNIGVFIRESERNQAFPFSFFEEISYQLPEHLFQIEE